MTRAIEQLARIPLVVCLLAITGLGSDRATGAARFLPGDTDDGPAVGTQLTPFIAAGGSGYLAVWQELRSSPFVGPPFMPEGRGIDIYARRLDADGMILDAAPIAIATGFGDQVEPRVAWNGSSWLVAWETPCECWSYSSHVEAVRVSPAGVVLDPTPIIVHTNAYEGFELTSNGSEWLVVTETLRGVRIAADGALLNPGGTQLVVRTTSGRHAIVSAQGEYLLVWDGWGAAQGQRFTADLTPIGSPFPVPSVAIASNGQTYFSTWTIDDTYWDDFVYGQQIALDGTPGPVVTLAGAGGGLPVWNPAQMAVGWDGSRWWVAWLETTRGTVFTRVEADGTVLDFGGLAVDPSAPTSVMYAPRVAGRPGGGAQLVWQDKRADGSRYDIHTAAADTAGVPGTPAILSTSSPSQLFIDFAAGPGEILAVYLSEHSGDETIVARRLDAAGNPLDPAPIAVAAGSGLGRPHVGFDGTRYLVVWTDDGQVYGRRLQPDGTPVDAAPFAIMNGEYSDVAGLDGTFLVVTTRQTTGPHFFHPFSMRVDGASAVNLDPAPVILGQYFARYPRVIAFAGRWLATWQRNVSHDNPQSSLFAAFIELDGATGGEFNYGLGGGTPDVATAGGTALFVWRKGSPGFGNDVLGRFVAADGTLAPATLTISAGAEEEFEPVVGWDGTEFVIAWTDKRNSIIYFDERTEVYAARVRLDGTIVDPAGFAFGDRSLPEIDPAIVGIGGRTVIAASSFRDEPEHETYRIAYQVFGDPATGNRWPAAVAVATPTRGDTPLSVTFDAAGTTDPDGTVVAYAWDFGDGGTATSSTAGHTYSAVGNYLADLTVTDDGGASTSNVVRVVVDAVNQPPVAVAVADRTSGAAPLSVVFNAQDSWDPDTGIQNWEWAFGDGGTYWGSTAYHTFNTEGVWTVTLTVHDFRGAIGSDTLDVTVGASNQRPEASAMASVLAGPAPLSVAFDGSGSSDPDGSIATHAWSFGDGAAASGATTGHTYDSPGSYTATLTVTDGAGATSSDAVAIEVGPGDTAGWTTADMVTTSGTVSSGTHLDTHDQNDVPEMLTEETTSGSPSQRRSMLDHVWTMNVASGRYQVLRVDAFHTANTEGDEFLLEYSRDQVAWTPMLTVSRTADNDILQEYWFTESVTGTLYVRAIDTDRTPGHGQADTLYVDEMFVLSMPSMGWVGTVPDGRTVGGSALFVSHNPDGSLSMSWGDSCMTSDTDYAVYEGPLGAFSDHVPVVCSTAGATNATVTPAAGARYYLVVAHDGAYQGSYGEVGQGGSRASGLVQCFPTAPTPSCP